MNPKGLEIVDLREVDILRHLTDQQLASIKAVHVYGSDRCSFYGPSALYVTKNDEVFLTGFDSLVGKSCTDMMPGGRKRFLEKSVLVEGLSGKAVQKIVVGADFGAALTTCNDFYMWGSDVGTRLTQLTLECHYDEACCPKCSGRLHTYTGLSGGLYSNCHECGGHPPNRVFAASPPDGWKGKTRAVLGYETTGVDIQIPNLFCGTCEVFKQCYSHPVSNFSIVHCGSCKDLIDGNSHKIPPQTEPAPHGVASSIKDIAAGMNFLLIQTNTELIIWGSLGGNRYNHALQNPDKIKFAKVACGSAHIAVISDKGDLFTCGVGDKGQLGYAWSATDCHVVLKKVPLKEPAVDVACGRNSTVCLSQNGTHEIFGDVTKVVVSGTWSLNLFEVAIISVPVEGYRLKIMQSSLEHLMKADSKRSAVLTGGFTDAFILLQGLKHENPDGKSRTLRWIGTYFLRIGKYLTRK